jgi:putative DNA methylase
MTTRKKLIEVALPLEAINDASAYDKMPGIGAHPKGIHHWWARLPLPCARAILFASLVDDPSSDPAFANKSESEQNKERDRLFEIIRLLMQKRAHENPGVFLLAHKEIARCCNGALPRVADPFAGGGSIPLEARRLGLEAFASDLNPIAVLINRAMIEIVPKFSETLPINPRTRNNKLARKDWGRAFGLADDVRYYSELMLEKAKARIGNLYREVKLPTDAGGAHGGVIAWVWARNVNCPNPSCRGKMPLVSSFLLSKKKKVWVDPIVDYEKKVVRFEVRSGGEAPAPTKIASKGSKFKCLICDQIADDKHIKAEGIAGGIGFQLMAVVTDGGRRGRIYLSPTPEQENFGIVPITSAPDEVLPHNPRAIYCPLYGLKKHRDLYTPRQLAALGTFSDLIAEFHQQIISDAVGATGLNSADERSLASGGNGPRAYADAVSVFLSFAVDRCTDFNSSLCRWSSSNEKVMGLFGAQRIPMIWDFAEANTLGDSVGSWSTCSAYVADCIEVILPSAMGPGQVMQLDATTALRNESRLLISTDPPYYDNIPYADLSDFFYVWLRRSLRPIFPDLFSTILTPKSLELVAAPERFDNDKAAAKEHFEKGFHKVFSSLRERMDQRFPLTLYYAFKQEDEDSEQASKPGSTVIDLTTGWETLLEAVVSAAFQVTGTWPVRASQAWRMRSMGSNALASYVVLACRPRSDAAPLATRREFMTELKRQLPDALKKLQHGNIAPVDLAQASIGPGMAVFSRYSKVVESDGSPMRIRTALQLINQSLDEVLAEQESEYDAETRWAVAWFDQFGITEGAYGTAETLSKAKNTSITGMDEAGVTASRAGRVRLLRRDELIDDWNPAKDKRLTVWEVTQHMIRALDTGGEQKAAALLKQVGALGEIARDLAYRLFTTSERKGWTQEAFSYNSLVVAWPEIKRVAGMPAQIANENLFEY